MRCGNAYTILLWGLCMTLAGAVRADRLLLAPSGEALAPDSSQGEFLIAPDHGDGNITWLQYGTPGGIKLDGQRTDVISDPRALYALNIQYPVLIDLNGLPSLSVGVRDLLGTGEDHRSFYIACTKALVLSRRQRRVVREFRATLGFGTERMDGLFIGVQTRLALGVTLTAEVFRQRPNFGVDLPLMRGLQASVTSLNGSPFYGVTIRFNH
jgi:Exopolysaccharide biosynthesis protein YbjH